MIRLSAGDRHFVPSQMRRAPELDGWLMAAAGVLLLVGLACIYSVDTVRQTGNFLKQTVFAVVGVFVLLACLKVNLQTLRRIAPWLYGFNLLMLLGVLVAGVASKGAQRWLEIGPLQFQPSEFAKVLLILTLASYYANRSLDIQDVKTYLVSILHVLPPTLLVFMQPHLGAAVSMLAIWAAISIYAGVPWKFLAITALAMVALGFIAVKSPWILKEYQRDRLVAMLAGDPRDDGYQATRARIAFGVGGVYGTGFLKGEQKAAKYIPEQHNDFVFTVVGEEGGLIGSSLVLLAAAFFLYRVWLVGYRASDMLGRCIAGGILGVFAFHTVINLGMNLTMLPIAGLWLPFVSYGGTALWMCMASIGLLANVH